MPVRSKQAWGKWIADRVSVLQCNPFLLRGGVTCLAGEECNKIGEAKAESGEAAFRVGRAFEPASEVLTARVPFVFSQSVVCCAWVLSASMNRKPLLPLWFCRVQQCIRVILVRFSL